MIMQNLQLAWNSIRSAKLRSFLTMLGVIIGVVSVVSVVSIGQGIKNQVRQEIEGFGTDLVQITPGKSEGGFSVAALLGGSALTEEDLNDVQSIPNVRVASPVMIVDAEVHAYGKVASGTTIMGTDGGYLEIANQKMSKGEFLSERNAEADVVVIGSDLANEFFGGGDAIGRRLSIRGEQYTIIGITEHYESLLTSISSGFNINKMVYLPLSAAKQLERGAARIIEIDAKVADTAQLDTTVAAMQEKLADNRGGDRNFTVTQSKDAVKMTDAIFNAVTAGVSGLAGISVLVGIVGIMNIMFTIVTERTREIGIRKSIGASNRQILSQFLTESIVISLIGAAIGVAIAMIIGLLIKLLTNLLEPSLTLPVILIVMAGAVIVGIIAGLWPAIRAARKDPVEALRYE